MFSKVLIANRGEIACRVICTCRRLGITTVAVYSEADAGSLHVREADEAYCIGSPPPSESYLNIRRIVRVAKKCHADAVHPGYGFLSENPRFARALEKAKIRFIGPTPEAISRMKDKVRARALAREAGVPIVPGTETEVSDRHALARAAEIGFPLLVKAAEGGGGIGMHVVEHPDALAAIMERARRTAKNAFGSGRLYLERYLPGASHVEVQVLADHHGNAIHLWERDCSVQRRNQKVVEEAPCPKLDRALRHRITEAALALVRHIGYTNAGTVEFLLDREGEFYFLEMNRRLQVEHPVTEMITGLDLVELQLRVAAGEPLPVQQGHIKRRGHAIEARIYPEDPETLVPMAGTVDEVVLPQGRGVRVDSALEPGYQVTTYYDPLLAKVIVWGTDREQAIKKLHRALDDFHVHGVPTNIPLVMRATGHPDFLNGVYTTGLLPRLLGQPSVDGFGPEMAAVIAAAVAVVQVQEAAVRPSPWKMQGRRQLMLGRLNGGVPW